MIFIDTDNNMLITRGEGGWREVEVIEGDKW